MSMPEPGGRRRDSASGDLQPSRLGQVVLVVFLGAVGVGAVVALYDRGVLPVAGIFVAMVVGPLIILLRRRWLVARHRGLVTSLRGQLGVVLEDLESRREARDRPDARTLVLASEARDRLDAGDEAGAVRRVEALIGSLSDGPRSAVADGRVEDLRVALERLKESRRRLDGARA